MSRGKTSSRGRRDAAAVEGRGWVWRGEPVEHSRLAFGLGTQTASVVPLTCSVTLSVCLSLWALCLQKGDVVTNCICLTRVL